jgi:hypothetical protein
MLCFIKYMRYSALWNIWDLVPYEIFEILYFIKKDKIHMNQYPNIPKYEYNTERKQDWYV